MKFFNAALMLMTLTSFAQASTIVHRNCEVDEILYGRLPVASQSALEEILVKKGYKVDGVNNKDGLIIVAMVDTSIQETQILEDIEVYSWQDRIDDLKKRTDDAARKFMTNITNKFSYIGFYVWDTKPGYVYHSYEDELASREGIFLRKSLGTNEKFINGFMAKVPKCKVQKSQL